MIEDNRTLWQRSMEVFDKLEIAPFEISEDHYFALLNAGADSIEKDKKANKNLAGHIQREFELDLKDPKLHDFQKFVLGVTDHEILEGYKNSISPVDKDRPFCFSKLWINYQKKYEFNPMHVHRGVFSFVLFMKIPYDLEQEDKVFPDTVNPGKFEGYHDDLRTSRFVFVNPDPLYGMKQIPLHVDKSFEGKGCLFRSLQNHMVYPFYTSDETRVTVSGNIVIHV